MAGPVSNPLPLAHESNVLSTELCGPDMVKQMKWLAVGTLINRTAPLGALLLGSVLPHLMVNILLINPIALKLFGVLAVLSAIELNLPQTPLHTPSEQTISEPSLELGILQLSQPSAPDEYPLSLFLLPNCSGFLGDRESQLLQLSIDANVVLELWSAQS